MATDEEWGTKKGMTYRRCGDLPPLKRVRVERTDITDASGHRMTVRSKSGHWSMVVSYTEPHEMFAVMNATRAQLTDLDRQGTERLPCMIDYILDAGGDVVALNEYHSTNTLYHNKGLAGDFWCMEYKGFTVYGYPRGDAPVQRMVVATQEAIDRVHHWEERCRANNLSSESDPAPYICSKVDCAHARVKRIDRSEDWLPEAFRPGNIDRMCWSCGWKTPRKEIAPASCPECGSPVNPEGAV